MTIFVFFVVLAVLVLVHELGHFLAAKAIGVKVEEFGFGFPPRIWGIRRGETIYSVNWIPFGGFVKIFGENAGEESLDLADRARSLEAKPRHLQAMVLAAGVVFNFILAWIILSLGFVLGMPTAAGGVPEGYRLEQARLTIVDVVPGSPAAQSGLSGGEAIAYISDGVNKITNPAVKEVQDFIAARGGQPVKIGYQMLNEESGQFLEKEVIPGGDHPSIGVALEEIGILKLPFVPALWQGLKASALVVWSIVTVLIDLITGLFQGETAILSSVTGPVGLVGIIGTSLSLGFAYLLNLTAIISLNLAVINLLPFPALDGGRILFLAIEAVRRKAISPKLVNALNSAGFFILIFLMVLLTYRDILRLF